MRGECAHVLLEMAEWFAAHGERDLARECRATANKILDYVMFAAQVVNNPMNRS